jgi:hypothetical protein
MRYRDDGGAALSDDQVADNVLGVLFAAQDTTASVLTWVLKFLHDHPKLLEAVKVSLPRRADRPGDPFPSFSFPLRTVQIIRASVTGTTDLVMTSCPIDPTARRCSVLTPSSPPCPGPSRPGRRRVDRRRSRWRPTRRTTVGGCR